MKASIFILSAIFALAFAAPPPLHDDDDGKLHIPDKCEDVLSVKVCDNLRVVAQRLKLKAEDVTRAVVDAVKKGKVTSVEIFNAAKEFLMNEVLNKKCEDFTSAETCEKLRKVASVLKVSAAKVEAFVIKAVAEGAVQAKDIYAKAMEYYKNEIATKTCEDFLSASQCSQLRSIASKLKIKFDVLEDAIKAAYLETLGDVKELYNKVISTLKDYALNTKCEDLLNPDLCAALRKYAALTKVQFPILMEKAVDLLIKGYNVGKGLLNNIYKLVDHFYDCTDIFDQSSCDKLYKMASYLGLGYDKVEEFIKKYVPIAIEKGKDLVNDFPSLVKALGSYLKEQFCKIMPFCFSADDVDLPDDLMFADDNLMIASEFEQIKNDIKAYIQKKFTHMSAEVKTKINAILDKAHNVAELLVNAVTEIALAGGKFANELKTILTDLIANIKTIVNSY